MKFKNPVLGVNELDEFYNYCVNENNLNVIGLMVLPPMTTINLYFKTEKLNLLTI